MIEWVRWLNERYIVNPQKKQISTLSSLSEENKGAGAFSIIDLDGPQYVMLLFFAFSLTLSPVNAIIAGVYCDDFINISDGIPFIFVAEGVVYFVAAASIVIKTAARYHRTICDKAPLRGSVRYGRFVVGVIIWPLGGALGAHYVLASAFDDVSCLGNNNVIDFIFYINSPFLFQMPLFVFASMATSLFFIILKRGA